MDLSYTVKDCHIVDVPTYTDERGTISVIDDELPFHVKRIFWLYHIKDKKDRGSHAILNSSEIIVAIHGSFMVDLDDGMNKSSVLLNSPEKGLIIRPGIWFRTHSYKEDGISLVIAEEIYSRDKYTYDYEEFTRLRSTK